MLDRQSPLSLMTGTSSCDKPNRRFVLWWTGSRLLKGVTVSWKQAAKSDGGSPARFTSVANSLLSTSPLLSHQLVYESEVKKRSQSCKMKGIEKHLHSGETHDGLYYTVSQEPRRPKPARRGDAIALPGVPTDGGWSKGARETLCILLRRNRSLYLLVIIPSSS